MTQRNPHRPFIGGVLSRPQDHWPDRFSHPFWAEYPYFLPCLVAATYALISFIVTAIYLGEVGLPETLGAIVGSYVIEDVRMQPFSQGPACGGQSRHFSEAEYQAGPAATVARATHETGPSVDFQLRDDRAARHGRHGAHSARLVDAGRARRTRLQSGVHRPLVVWIRVSERRRPVHHVPACRRASGTRAGHPHQRRGIRDHLHHVPAREPRRAREERERVAARSDAARVDMYHRHGIQ
jgi:hypothetical protein